LKSADDGLNLAAPRSGVGLKDIFLFYAKKREIKKNAFLFNEEERGIPLFVFKAVK
jgi:hypothetical protein